MVRRRHAFIVLVACATALRPAAHVRRRVEPRYAEDGCEAAEGDVVVFALPDTVDPPGTPGERRLGVSGHRAVQRVAHHHAAGHGWR